MLRLKSLILQSCLGAYSFFGNPSECLSIKAKYFDWFPNAIRMCSAFKQDQLSEPLWNGGFFPVRSCQSRSESTDVVPESHFEERPWCIAICRAGFYDRIKKNRSFFRGIEQEFDQVCFYLLVAGRCEKGFNTGIKSHRIIYSVRDLKELCAERISESVCNVGETVLTRSSPSGYLDNIASCRQKDASRNCDGNTVIEEVNFANRPLCGNGIIRYGF